MNVKILWSGEFFSNFSLAIVNRRITSALIERGNVEIAIHTDPVNASMIPREYMPLVSYANASARDADIAIVNALWPVRLGTPGDARYVRVLPWEFGSMPLEWFEELRDDCDDVWAPTNYNRDIFVADGFPRERTFVVPHGVDTGVFTPNGPALDSEPGMFHFLFVGATISRKGIDLLVNAYLRAFLPTDNVCLTIKDVNADTFYRGNTHGDALTELSRKPGIPRIAYVDTTFEESGIASLYRAVDCLVHPYRGEGFGMPVLEAMACGVPVIVTAGGATDDFVDESVGWRVAATRRNCPPGTPVPTVGTAWLLEPDIDVLAAAMRFVYEHPEEAARRGAAGARRALAWTWDNAARIVEERCAELLARPAVPPKRRASRYVEPRTYEEQRAGSSNLDGILIELFRRVGVEHAAFMELNETEAVVRSTVFMRMQWKGLAGSRADVSPANIGEILIKGGVVAALDLLALGYDAGTIWRAIEPPRVVVCAAEAFPSLLTTALELGYSHLATESLHSDAVFVRNDLLARTSFRLADSQHVDVLGEAVGDRAS